MNLSRRNFLKATSVGIIAISVPLILFSQSVSNRNELIVEDRNGKASFVFEDGIPADYEQAVLWMKAQWGAGNKVIYPYWGSVA